MRSARRYQDKIGLPAKHTSGSNECALHVTESPGKSNSFQNIIPSCRTMPFYKRHQKPSKQKTVNTFRSKNKINKLCKLIHTYVHTYIHTYLQQNSIKSWMTIRSGLIILFKVGNYFKCQQLSLTQLISLQLS